jgi:hypothetical protein
MMKSLVLDHQLNPFMRTLYFITSIAILVFFASCKGKQGIEGKKSLIDLITEAPGTNCPAGGYKIVSGIDENSNNILDASEIQTTKYICNGVNGSNSLAALIQESPGNNCATGGYKIVTGIDLNNNNVLDANEIVNTEYVCNGLMGANSLVSLVKEPAGQNCPTGGYKVNTGTDLNKNGVLENNEITNSSYICNGSNGLNSLISMKNEPTGNNCTYGGYSFNTGIDVNKNGILDDNEITATEYICNNSTQNEVRIPLDFSANTSSTTGVSGEAVYNFNKANYPGLDSVIFTARPYTGGQGNSTILDLINQTDGVIWDDSRLSSSAGYDNSTYLTSKNLYHEIPDKSINIYMRVRSSTEGGFASTANTSYLILYPKK